MSSRMFTRCRSRRTVRGLSAAVIAAALAGSTQADVILSSEWARLYDEIGGTYVADRVLPGDTSLLPNGLAVLIQVDPLTAAALTVNGGSTLQAPQGLYTYTFPWSDRNQATIGVGGADSRIEIAGGNGTGNIVLRGWGALGISTGGSIVWDDDNACDGSFKSCDILIGDVNEAEGVLSGISNATLAIYGEGALLDASNTGGRLFVGFNPAERADQSYNSVTIGFGGELRSNEADIAFGWGGDAPWQPADGYLRGLADIQDGTWLIQGQPGEDSNFNIGEGDGASGYVAISRGGVVNVTANEGDEAGFFLGQSTDGVPTKGAENLLIVTGDGSRLSVDDNFAGPSGSRIANGVAIVQDSGALQLDSTFLLVSGKTGQTVSDDLFVARAEQLGVYSLSDSRNLDVIADGTLTITDNDSQGRSALIIGQTPDTGPTQEAHVLVARRGRITVTNDSGLPKIPLDASEFGIPVVSNIGTGSLEIDFWGTVEFQNGDFVIGVNLTDDATVTVGGGGQLTADRVVVGHADLDGIGPGAGPAATGNLVLDGGVVNGNVVVDDNGVLAGVGTVNGDVIGSGGTIAPGFSPGTIIAKNFDLGPGTTVILEVALNPDGSVNTALSDSLAVSEEEGTIDLSESEITFELSSADESTTVNEILSSGQVLDISEVFDTTEEVVVGNYTLTNPSGSISDKELRRVVEVVGIHTKSACKKGGWRSLLRPDGTSFIDQGSCISFVNTGE